MAVFSDRHDQIVREQLRIFRGREVNTTGDGFVASFDGPARAIRCGQAIIDATSSLGIELRIGLHTGECKVRGNDLGGLAVHIAARIGSLASANEVLVSGTVKDLVVGSGLDFKDRGEHVLEGGARELEALRGLPLSHIGCEIRSPSIRRRTGIGRAGDSANLGADGPRR